MRTVIDRKPLRVAPHRQSTVGRRRGPSAVRARDARHRLERALEDEANVIDDHVDRSGSCAELDRGGRHVGVGEEVLRPRAIAAFDATARRDDLREDSGAPKELVVLRASAYVYAGSARGRVERVELAPKQVDEKGMHERALRRATVTPQILRKRDDVFRNVL
jgi:hypothetical protein